MLPDISRLPFLALFEIGLILLFSFFQMILASKSSVEIYTTKIQPKDQIASKTTKFTNP
jgi:hypothetical protein